MIRIFVPSVFLLFALFSSAQNDYKAYYEKAKAEEKKKDYANAIIDYSNAIKLDSTQMDPFYHRALVKFHLPDYAGTVMDLNKTIEFSHKIARGIMEWIV
jgi:tetratricopeptide (TPR) repeat protein